MKKIALSILVLCLASTLLAKEMPLKSGVTAYWYSTEELPNYKPWTAAWIWGDKEAELLMARRVFELNEIPQEAILRLTASSHYELYINGQYVLRGPARCVAHHQSYDILDVASLLQKGNNTIAIKVHFQPETVSYQHKGRAGILAQLDYTVSGKEQSLISDDKWKVKVDISWDKESPRIARFHTETSDWADLSQAIKAWETTEYNDASWQYATILLRNVGWPLPRPGSEYTVLTIPWTGLVARDIPYLDENEIAAQTIVEAKSLEVLPTLTKRSYLYDGDFNKFKLTGDVDKNVAKQIKKNKPIQIDLDNHYFLLYDFGKVTNGRPHLKLQGKAGSVVHVLSAPYIIDEEFTSNMLASNLSHRISLSGELDEWHATYFNPTRYMALVFEKSSEPAFLHYTGVKDVQYPFQEQGTMTASAPWVQTYWDAAKKTIRTCTSDAYTDNYRERRQYAQTGYYGAKGNYWTFGDTELQRRYLIQTSQEQKPNGIMPAYAPLFGEDYMVIYDSNCLWIRSLHDYYMYSGDEKTVQGLLPAAERMMDLFQSYVDDRGLLYNPPYSYWLDHAVNDRQGANLCFNGHYLGALDDFTKVMKRLGNDEEASVYAQRADKLRSSLRQLFWNESEGLFVDALLGDVQSKMLSEHGNAVALANGVATKEQAQKMVKHLLKDDELTYNKRENGMTVVTPAMSYFLHKGLSDYGYTQESMDLFNKRFAKIIEPQNNGTLWEEWWLNGSARSGQFKPTHTRSDAQTESAFPPALFVECLLGLEVTAPGMTRFSLLPTMHDVESISTMLPTPHGLIRLKRVVEGKDIIIQLDLPSQIILDVDPVNFSNCQLFIDGEEAFQDVKIVGKSCEIKMVSFSSNIEK